MYADVYECMCVYTMIMYTSIIMCLYKRKKEKQLEKVGGREGRERKKRKTENREGRERERE